MKENFFQKKGTAVMQLAQELLIKHEGDRLPIVSELQAILGISRGTVQNALNFLKEEKAIELISRGHQGTFIEKIDYRILQKYAVSESLFGTMPLPYSKLYEGLATALYDTFKEHDIRLNMAYVRGSSDRISSVTRGMYQFAVVSKYAAEFAIKEDNMIEIITDLGAYSYLSQHILLLSNPEATAIVDGDRVGIDLSSIDQMELTYLLCGDKKVTFVNMPGHQLIHEIEHKRIDAGVWNYDEIIDKNYQHLNYQLISELPLSEAVSTAVIVCRKDDTVLKTVLRQNIEKDTILDIQQKVKVGSIIPRY